MTKTIALRVVTPERSVFEESVAFFSLRGEAGELGILPEHIPLCANLSRGVLSYRLPDGRSGSLTVMGGILNVQPDRATVLAEAAERAEEIDVARARAAKARAESRMADQRDRADELALERALVRIEAFDAVASSRR
ncbi:MAG: ATP synthase F1 subunit epsilon [Candidatus Sericytochromatia bacterium]|nr:ATP synthase F1 subunit epsilon [Candidatus Sericytochromatia bacterium]